MGDTYYGKTEIQKLGQLKRLRKDLFDSFSAFDAKVFADGALPSKAKELIAVACAHITRCPYCIDAHTRRASAAGASAEEIAEAIFVSAAMSAGASIAHSCIAMESLAEGREAR